MKSKNNDWTPPIAAWIAALQGDIENAAIASTPGGIEAQEARGQRDLVAREILPRDGGMGKDSQPMLEKIGIVVHGQADDLFYNVTLPAGWKKVATSHSMHSDLIDDQGRKRAGIFYKAAFYDRSAHISLDRRYTIQEIPVGGYDNFDWAQRDTHPYVGQVVDTETGNVIFETEPVVSPAYGALRKQAEAWIGKHYPDWQDPFAYWS